MINLCILRDFFFPIYNTEITFHSSTNLTINCSYCQVPGVPIMYITKHRYSIERLPEATIGGGRIKHLFINFIHCKRSHLLISSALCLSQLQECNITIFGSGNVRCFFQTVDNLGA